MNKNFKITKEAVIGFIIFIALLIVVVSVYNHENKKLNRELTKRIAELNPRGGVPETIDGLKQAVALYEAQIELHVKDGAQTGIYWKILAVRLADKGMHRDALLALERALYYNAADPVLFYLTGESASIVAANYLQFSAANNSEREHFYKLAETAYQKAIALDDAYAKPLLGIGYLYTFDLNRPSEAVPYLQRYLKMLPNDVKAMFVLARAYYMTENFDEAISLYDRILIRSKDTNVRAQAENNKEIIRSLINE